MIRRDFYLRCYICLVIVTELNQLINDLHFAYGLRKAFKRFHIVTGVYSYCAHLPRYKSAVCQIILDIFYEHIASPIYYIIVPNFKFQFLRQNTFLPAGETSAHTCRFAS